MEKHCPLCGGNHALLFIADPEHGEAVRAVVDAVRVDLGLPPTAVVEVDVFREPAKALRVGAIATPSLVVDSPTGDAWLVGTFDDHTEIRRILQGLVAESPGAAP